MVSDMVQLSRRIVSFVRDSPHYDWLPDNAASLDTVFMTVMIRAKDKALNDALVEKINATRQLYVSGTSWRGEKAVRIAVSNWKVDVEKDARIVCDILTSVAEGKGFEIEKYQE